MTPSKIRMAVRAVVVCATAFGLNLTADQVAAVYLVTEAVLQFLVKDPTDK
jgi:hypothetical protein